MIQVSPSILLLGQKCCSKKEFCCSCTRYVLISLTQDHANVEITDFILNDLNGYMETMDSESFLATSRCEDMERRMYMYKGGTWECEMGSSVPDLHTRPTACWNFQVWGIHWWEWHSLRASKNSYFMFILLHLYWNNYLSLVSDWPACTLLIRQKKKRQEKEGQSLYLTHWQDDVSCTLNMNDLDLSRLFYPCPAETSTGSHLLSRFCNLDN